MSTTTQRVRYMKAVAGMDEGYSWWEITSPNGLGFEMAYSAEQALAKHQERQRQTQCSVCKSPLGYPRWRWYGRDYCSEVCLARGKRAQYETSQEDRYWEQRDEYGAARMGVKPS